MTTSRGQQEGVHSGLEWQQMAEDARSENHLSLCLAC